MTFRWLHRSYQSICQQHLPYLHSQVTLIYSIRIYREKKATALMDTGSFGSFVSYDYAKKYSLKINPTSGTVSMASSSLNASLKGRCSVNINLLSESYSNIQLSVSPGLCCDVILNQDFMNHHSSVSFSFGGPRKSRIISNSTACCVPSASVNSPSLFLNLTPNCKPIFTKSWRFGNEDKHFIQSEIDTMLQEGVIEESISPWRAQVLIVSDKRKKKKTSGWLLSNHQ